jgi:Uma2 family endonuclease
MSLPQLKRPGYTLADWQGWEGRWELIQGEAYAMTPAPSLEHQRISVRMVSELFAAIGEAKRKAGGGDCEVLAAPCDVFLFENTVVQPDLLVVCDPAKKSARGIEGPPDLVVEILSPATGSKDTVRKRWLYESAGVKEYLIVDPMERVGELLRLDDLGRYQTAARLEWGAQVAVLGDTIPLTLGE